MTLNEGDNHLTMPDAELKKLIKRRLARLVEAKERAILVEASNPWCGDMEFKHVVPTLRCLPAEHSAKVSTWAQLVEDSLVPCLRRGATTELKERFHASTMQDNKRKCCVEMLLYVPAFVISKEDVTKLKEASSSTKTTMRKQQGSCTDCRRHQRRLWKPLQAMVVMRLLLQ
eukprot:4250581-Amphidinium_carterae.2